MGSTRTHANPHCRGLCVVLALAAIWLAACESRSPLRIRPGPVVNASTIARSAEFMQKVAVMPFYPVAPTGRSIGGGLPAVSWESAALVSGYFADALAAQGVAVIPAGDREVAVEAQGGPVPRLDPRIAAERAASDFGATAVVLGKLFRWREREGSAAGAAAPASVAFEVSLHQAPSGRRLWTGRFDETQRSITEAILRARQYPGAGTRWLSVAEFGRWGAEETVKSMTSAP
ncbi:MAG: hypothetical protein ACE5FL_02850 [Myxococcota bacterium]